MQQRLKYRKQANGQKENSLFKITRLVDDTTGSAISQTPDYDQQMQGHQKCAEHKLMKQVERNLIKNLRKGEDFMNRPQ